MTAVVVLAPAAAAPVSAASCWLGRPWFSYGLIALLQAKVLWGIWRLRDLTTGDTSSYFGYAYDWAERLTVNIVWSPLYTAFYGSIFAVTRDAYAATITHRIVIILAASLGVLAVMRAVLPPGLALLVAAWWAILPINFNTLYEVHLFAVLPVLAIWIVAASSDHPRGRGIAVALLIVTTVLVRNEMLLATVLFASACAVRETLDLRRTPPVTTRRVLVRLGTYLAPAAVAVALCGGFYARSTVRGPQVQAAARLKHTLNMCQVYAFGYSQRHPDWTASPWTECYDLARATFGRGSPSLREMVAENPPAVLEHVAWNLALTPAGLQLALFNGTWGGPNPDYAPVEHPGSAWATVLAGAACVALVLGAILAVRHWSSWWHDWFRPRRGVWMAMFAVACVSAPVILTQRPRPSYLFALTLCLMAIIGSAIHLLTHRWPRARDYTCLAAVAAALVLIPPYFVRHPSNRPLATAYWVLRPLSLLIADASGKVVMGDYAEELRSYAGLRGVQRAESYGILRDRLAQENLGNFLNREQVSVFLIQPRILPTVKEIPGGETLLADPESAGWHVRSTTTPDGSRWILLFR